LKTLRAAAAGLGSTGVAGILLGAALLTAPSAQEFGRLGLAVKSGESSGGFGAQFAYNFDPHWQAVVGVGGASIPYILEFGNARTDSHFLMGKYFFRHLFLASGYSHKRSRADRAIGGRVYRDAASAHGLPFHVGYEFGNRKGFFFSTSVGLLYVFQGGDREVRAGADSLWTTIRTAATGPSVGLTLGYYFSLPE
jgi:hypothetical protein